MAACHVCWHPALRQASDASAGLTRLLLQELPALAALVRIARLDSEEDRREELARRCLRALGRRPHALTSAQRSPNHRRPRDASPAGCCSSWPRPSHVPPCCDAGLRPQGLISTAMALPPALAERLETVFGCPAIDIYSLNESGPLAYRCRNGHHHILPPDVFVEVLDPRGQPCPAGARGEITLSGGRNPNLVLWRYRTGDHASLRHDPCPCSDPRPRLVDLEGRTPVRLTAADGGTVATVDVSRGLRRFHLLRHRLVQRQDRSLELTVLPLPGDDPPEPADLAALLHALFGPLSATVTVAASDWSNGGKEPAYIGLPA